MKKTSLLFLILAWAIQVTAQEITLEKLKKELDTHQRQDSFRVNRLIELSFSPALSFTERRKLATEALIISRKIGYQKGEGIALINTGYFTFRTGDKKTGDSLIGEAQAIAKKINDATVTGVLLYRQGLMIQNTTGDKAAVDSLLKAEAAFETSGNIMRLLDCQSAIGGYYQGFVSNYPLALEYFQKYIHSAEKLNLSTAMVDGYINISTIYSILGDNTTSLVYLDNAKAVVKRTNGTPAQLNGLYNGFSEAYRLSGRYKEAIGAYNLAIENMPPGVEDYVDESNLADVYVHMDSLPLAFQYAFRSFSESRKLADPRIMSWISGILARAYLKKSMPDSSIYYARSGLDSAIKTGTIEFMRDNAAALADAYAYKKDFTNAYNYHLQYINYRDSMLSAEVRNKTAVLQYSSDLDKKQSQIAQLNQQKVTQQRFLSGALIALSLILIMAVLLLRNNRQKVKANNLLQKQKKEIDDKAQELSVQKDNLQQSYNNVEQLSEIGRKITSSLSVEKIIATVYDNVNLLMDASVFGIGIYNDDRKRIEFPATFEDGKALPFYYNDVDDPNRFAVNCFKNNKEIIMGNLAKEYMFHTQQVVRPREGKQSVSLIYLPLVVKENRLGVITVQSFEENAYTDYHLFMLRNIAIYTAIALENAESYEELNHTVDRLKSTQAQLIQSEKMASLGELTAGIAHEIQNPLNFVNNFSEINNELIEELKSERSKEKSGRNEEAEGEILDDIQQNLQKISMHGKRAESIVKGMLHHSQSNTGTKEPIDINALTDEYLRLAYHGLRAKDKSFNATTKTEFDHNIHKVQVVPQDIGRVLLNLINNAYYTVTEKKKQKQNGYDPTVTVTTIRNNGHIEIKVKDNGNGIPQKILDKIFQPFFTTKPTGQGTGLGLSLSYDIVKAHGGKLKVETSEGEGSTFIVQLQAV